MYRRIFIASSGVPQGSVLGPQLFILFINDISFCFSLCNFLLYADDLKIYYEIKCPEDSSILQCELNNLYSWCVRNRLFLNISKCHYTLYAKVFNVVPTAYYISNSPLKSISELKDIGVYFDSKLNFTTHINFILSKSFAMLAFIRRNSSSFSDPYTLKLLYSSLVRSRLEYAVFVWKPFHAVYINRLESVQRAFVRFALRSMKFVDPIPSYRSRCLLINLMSLESRRVLLSMCFVFDICAGSIDCPYLLNKINFNVPSRIFRCNELFFVGIAKTVYGMNAPFRRTLAQFNAYSSSLVFDFSYSKFTFKKLLIRLLS